MGRERGHGQKLLYLARGRRQDESIQGAAGARQESGYRHRVKENRRNGTTFTKLQKEHFEISVALGTFILSAAATSKTNIYKSVYNSKGSLGVCSYSNKL